MSGARFSLVLAACLSLSPLVPAVAGGDSLTESGACQLQGVVEFPADPADVAPFVPTGFDLADESGRVRLTVAAASCTSSVDGHPARVAIIVATFAQIHAPCGPDEGFQGYGFWSLTDHPELAARWRGLGLGDGLVRDATFQQGGGGDIVLVQADLRGYEPSPHILVVEGTQPSVPVPPDGREDLVLWTAGSRGIVRRGAIMEPLSESPAAGAVRAEPGSPLFRMLGSLADPDTGEARGDGRITRFAYVGTAQLDPC